MAPSICLGTKQIGEFHPVFIIAEIGQNHQGDIRIAKKLIKIAKQCGADCAKFQKTCIQEKFTKHALNRPYTHLNSWGKTYGEHKNHLEFSEDEFRELQAYAKEIGILFTASAMDLESLRFLISIGVPFVKIGSGDSNNTPLIEAAAATKLPLVISTGMSTLQQVTNIYQTVSKYHKNFALLHCVSAYPTPLEEINLRVINLYERSFLDIVIGYSGHELEAQASLGAVALGAKILERHITLDKSQKGTDHSCSLEPHEFKLLIDDIRKLETALGLPKKEFQLSEKACFEKLGKSMVAAKDLHKNDVIESNSIKVKVANPKGMDPTLMNKIIGKVVNVEVIEEDEAILEEWLQ